MGGSLPHSLYTAEQTRNLDAETIHNHGIPGIELMKRAGQASFEVAMKTWPQVGRGGSLQVFCGAGNNGGDGYIIAALARQRYIPVRVISLKPPERLTGDARKAWEWFRDLGGRCESWSEKIKLTGDLIIDAMLGTGLSGDVCGDFANAINLINQSEKPVLAVDIPSGLSADTGAELGTVIKADVTVTFIGMKRGLFTGVAPRFCGDICFADLGVPKKVYDITQPAAHLIKRKDMAALVHPRARDANKGSHGHLLVIGGDHGMGGASIMTAETALRCGAGLVTLATRSEHVMGSLVRRPEVMVRGVDSAEDLEPLLEGKTAIAIGPGLGKKEWGRSLLQKVLETDIPLLIDADALNIIAHNPDMFLPRTHCVITPHPGEASRLLSFNIADVAADRFTAVGQLQTLCGGTAILKGAGTLIASSDTTWLCRAGNPGMAVAGMGDVLSGIMGALLAQGYYATDVAKLGVWLHATAGDDCAAAGGEIGIAATDLIPAVRKQLNRLTEE
ncbi:NAD(P)H-hydrate dehydratase [Parendozoicomonas sp. Alg238-R29]|uniref:NAD(P)H-hydrate dehydratase n=1 Tax=Parendozoicomonas sp. Alg238-R29 TaxID=2993446 RepID=UPI00248F1CA6|nr:NAD(P)H-hydrate dehydratase [Parendozoicomonas sp. Alg238-R29]